MRNICLKILNYFRQVFRDVFFGVGSFEVQFECGFVIKTLP